MSASFAAKRSGLVPDMRKPHIIQNCDIVKIGHTLNITMCDEAGTPPSPFRGRTLFSFDSNE